MTPLPEHQPRNPSMEMSEDSSMEELASSSCSVENSESAQPSDRNEARSGAKKAEAEELVHDDDFSEAAHRSKSGSSQFRNSAASAMKNKVVKKDDDEAEAESMIGKSVRTPYGVGIVTDYRGATDKTFVVDMKDLANTTLYTNTSYYAVDKPSHTKQKSVKVSEKLEAIPKKASEAKPGSPVAKSKIETTTKTPPPPAVVPSHPVVIKRQTTMELDVAYQALEKMRVLNLEMECFERGVDGPIDSKQCTKCLLTHQSQERFPRLQKFVDNTKSHQNTRFPRIQKSLWGKNKTNNQEPEKTVVLPRIQRLMDKHQRVFATPCLICAAPSCSKHSSAVFRKEKITLCHSCERFFELDFISECVSNPNPAERARNVDRMIDLYDRSLLLLRYSAQYIDDVAMALEQNTEKQNKIGLGSSGAGIVSGALGIAAAATILTPAGPPLLIASLLFGGSATAVQTGTEALNYYSEPSKLADRIIALYGISKSLLRVTGTLRDIIARHGRLVEGEEKSEDATTMQERVQENYVKNRQGLVAASTVGGTITLGSAVGSAAEVGAIGGARSATALSRAGTAAARTARFARFAGGALSAAVLVMEANAIQSTVKEIRAGNPCEKADTLRKILKELDEFPSTDTLDGECQAYLETLERPVRIVKDEDQFCQPGATILDGEDPESMEQAAASDSKLLKASATSNGGRSLIERIKMHKDRQSSTIGNNEDSSGLRDKGLRDLDLDLIS